ncbi:PEP-CTERM sorting domain-containing protein [Aliiruegeria sabulilitoris]|uniref:PEP-CTERM sorting domain-containing protein n=1 Tax=Aliiruegeria sabulilitoris TaxID=1510458 RepID=UPI0008353640|nr:PEP-CTERM sorting domain-containing protein [Aliiruegeria sabulilitoris]
MDIVRKCIGALLASLALLCLPGIARPVQALSVTYDYALTITSVKGSVEQSPFELSEDVQITGTMIVAFSDGDNQASVLDSSFVITWDGGSYDSGAAMDAKFSEIIAPDGQQQDIFRVQDRSAHGDLGDFAFELLRLDVMVPAADGDSVVEDYFFGALEDASKNSFDLRFINGSDKLTYAGTVAFLKAQDAVWVAEQQSLSAVPAPSSAASMLGGLILFAAFLGRRRRKSL